MAIGKFEVLGPLGRGAGSTIFRIRREQDRKVYALKIVAVQDADERKYVEQVQHEYDVASKLNHPNLCKVYELEINKTLFGKVTGAKLLMEYVDGRPLADLAQLPIAKQLILFYRVAEALAHMHALGFYHADIKPDNIMVTTTGDAKVIDFGLVWRRGEKKDRVQGTLEFLAPEQARKKIVNAKTDIFNFGATMYRQLAGAAIPDAFHVKGSSKYGNVDDLVRRLTDLNPQVPTAWDELVRRCLRFQPEERPAGMKDVARALKHIGKELMAQRQTPE